MKVSTLIAQDSRTHNIEMPTLYQDINVLLAELVGWKNLDVANDVVLVSQANEKPQKFDFLDTNVIYPIAEKYNKKANPIGDSEWSCEYLTKEEKKMVIISETKETALALALVLEFCI